MTLSRHLYAVLGIFAVLTAASLSTTHAARVQTQPVLVLNTTAQAVPTIAQGITPVTVNSQPPVQLMDGSNIAVNNTFTNPVKVQDVGGTRTYVNPTIGLTMADGSTSTISAIYTVPPNKRLTVTTVYGYTLIPANEQISIVLLGNMPLDFSAPVPSGDGVHYLTHALAQVNATYPAGTELDAFVARSEGTGQDQVSVSFFGYLEDAQ